MSIELRIESVCHMHNLRDLTIVGYVLTLAVLVGGGLIGFRNAQQLIKNDQMTACAQETLTGLETLLSTMKDAETGQRGYLLTEDEQYLTPYYDAVAGMRTKLAHLQDLMSDNSDQHDPLARLEGKIEAKLSELKRTIDLMKARDRTGALELVRSNAGKRLMDELRQDVGAMELSERELLRQRAVESKASSDITLLSIAIPSLMGTGLVGIVYFLSHRNMVQRRRAAEVADEQRERLRVTLTSIGDAVITTDAGGRITYLNPVAESLTGWASGEAINHPLNTVFRIINEETRMSVENPVRRVLCDGMVVGLANHTLLIRKDGSELAIDDSAAPIRDGKGEIVGCVLIFRDIGERRNLEKQNVESLAAANLLASVVASSEDAIISKSLDGIIQSWNSAAERLFGYKAKEAIGRHISLIIPPDHAREEEHIIRQIRAGKRVEHFETTRMRRDSTRLQISLTVSPIRNAAGEIVGASKIARDITDRKRAEKVLRETDVRKAFLLNLSDALRPLVDSIEIQATSSQLIGDQLNVNRAIFADIEGDDCIVRRGYVRGVPPIEGRFPVKLFGENLIASYRRGESIAVADVASDARLTVSEAASLRAIEIVAFAGVMLIKERRWVAAFVVHNATPREWTGEELELMSGVAERTWMAVERARSEAALQEADRQKDQFLATLAHELRNPLAPIRNSIEVMKRADGDANLLNSAVNTVDRQLGHLVRLVDDLIDISRISRNKIELRKEQIELASVLHQAVEAVRPLTEQAKQHVSMSLPPEPIYLQADPVRLMQIFGNLLNNASKYTESEGHIWITVELQNHNVMVRIKDSGVGIAPDALPNIFEMFTQVDRTLDRSQGGLGIGLSLVKRLVELHDGTVTAHSEGVDRGSEFVVTLPVHDKLQRREAEPSTSELKSTKPRRILVVDDNKDASTTLAMLLKLTGNEVQTAQDGLQAIEEAEQFRPDLVLLDIGLPKLNGYDACRRIREQPWGKDMVLVAATGWGQEDDRRKSTEAGFDHHLVKPVDFATLTKLLSELNSRQN